jgi:hypothetical protein
MNQHSKRGGQANGNSVDDMRRGATRPAAVVAIVLCVGFAVAMVAIWPFRKPRSHQEMQTQPEVAVQTEIPKPEVVSPVSVPPRDVLLEPSAATPVSQASPAAPSTAMPISQASPEAGWDNSPAPVQDDNAYDFSHRLNQETITFEAVNPTTQVPGLMTVTISGVFRGNRLSDGEASGGGAPVGEAPDGQSPVGSHLEADQQATFSFVPYDRYSPSYSATTKLQLAGDTTDNSIFFNFGLTAEGSDGSSQRFTLREVATITEDGAQVTFRQ